MNPVDGRQQKIVFGRDHDPEYGSKLAAAKAQADSDNSFMWGQQQMMDDIEQDGAGMIAEEARNRKYGNVNIETRPLMQGQDAAGVQEDSAGNQALENPLAQTGWLQGEVSGTIRLFISLYVVKLLGRSLHTMIMMNTQVVTQLLMYLD